MKSKIAVAVVAVLGVLGCLSFLTMASRSSSPPPRSDRAPAASPMTQSPPRPPSVDAAVDGLVRANVAFNVPEKMVAGQAEKLLLVLSHKLSLQVMQVYVAASTGAERVDTAQVRVGAEAEARLTGGSFDIKEATPARQALSEAGETKWIWEVTPKQPGRATLTLTLNTPVTVGGKEMVKSVCALERTLEITAIAP